MGEHGRIAAEEIARCRRARAERRAQLDDCTDDAIDRANDAAPNSRRTMIGDSVVICPRHLHVIEGAPHRALTLAADEFNPESLEFFLEHRDLR
jgi:hypothetical protein